MDVKNLTTLANTYKDLAQQEFQSVLIIFAQWFVKLQLILSTLMERLRKAEPKDFVLFKLALLGFGFFAGLCAPRRFRKFKLVVLFLSIACAAAFIYRLLTSQKD